MSTMQQHPDTPVFDLCAQFHVQQATLDTLVIDESVGDDECRRMFAARDETLEALHDLHPITESGRRAKAAVALAVLAEMQWPGITGALVRSVLCDVCGWSPS